MGVGLSHRKAEFHSRLLGLDGPTDAHYESPMEVLSGYCHERSSISVRLQCEVHTWEFHNIGMSGLPRGFSVTLVGLRNSHGTFVVRPWNFYGVSRGLPWNIPGNLLGLGSSHGTSVVLSYDSDCTCMGIPWYFGGPYY